MDRLEKGILEKQGWAHGVARWAGPMGWVRGLDPWSGLMGLGITGKHNHPKSCLSLRSA